MNYPNRKLGLIENLFDIIHDLGGMIDVNVARIEGSITPVILQQALDLLQKRHPMLQFHIVKLEDGAYFQSKGTTKIPLRVIDKQNENQWLQIAEDELHEKFPNDTSPLCRVTLLSSAENSISEIIATFHHAITDGISCMLFIDELLSYCQKIAADEDIPLFVTMQLLPALENLIDSSLTSKNNIVEEQTKEVIPTPQLIIEEEAPISDRRTCLVPRILNKEMTIMLINRCKQEETTVHGALCAAMLSAVAENAFTGTINLSCGSNVNLRQSCQPEVATNYIGCFISIVEEIHTLEENTKFWDLARECKSKISHSISLGIPINRICDAKLQYVNQDMILEISKHQMGRKNTIELSNRGKFNVAKKYGELKLKELYFATGQHLVGGSFWLGVVTFHEQLFCTFAHIVPLVSTKTAELLADSVMVNIQKACMSESFTLSKLNENEVAFSKD
ncbi:MAG: hypothetical protein KME60_23400 [Cyanomargarita calcarea GSE-NOS-MK-12-04C]|jgi:hypothetical protein|uniref:Condensation domain-containing protein n=1 Tax=Cyanomargarita calcarea GSE-NOS-MK-12-04C TaxID=2839659 RepID=A0A951QRE8_9CYAN|nr:hypothetical protein [Cyanomargarita calcarea GSE-NOS-MK-12-04C]